MYNIHASVCFRVIVYSYELQPCLRLIRRLEVGNKVSFRRRTEQKSISDLTSARANPRSSVHVPLDSKQVASKKKKYGSPNYCIFQSNLLRMYGYIFGINSEPTSFATVTMLLFL